jgi:DNA-binding transcriptional LysR family regulator
MRRWESYEAFVAVIDHGSFTAAAEKLRTSKSAVSRLVSGLEDRLGSQLLFRTTRHLAPTDLGRLVYRNCVDAFASLESIDREAMEYDAEPRGQLRIVASDTFGEICVAPLVTEMMKLHNQLEIELLITDRTVDIVAEGYDMAVRYSDLVDSSLRAQKLFELPHICVASPDYLQRHGTPLKPQDLKSHNCLVSTFEACNNWRFRHRRAEQVLALRGSWCSNNGPSLMEAAVQGIGVAWLPDLYVERHLKAGKLIEILEPYRASPMPVWAVYPARRQATAKVRSVIGYLRKRLPAVAERT